MGFSMPAAKKSKAKAPAKSSAKSPAKAPRKPAAKAVKPILMTRLDGLYLKDTGHKGRGLFCTKKIKKGTIIEMSPALPLKDKDSANVEKTLLCDYVFVLGKITKALQKKLNIKDIEDACCVIYGITSFCNHDDKPVAEVRWEEHGDTIYHSLVAISDIPANTEICTSYGPGWFDEPHRRASK